VIVPCSSQAYRDGQGESFHPAVALSFGRAKSDLGFMGPVSSFKELTEAIDDPVKPCLASQQSGPLDGLIIAPEKCALCLDRRACIVKLDIKCQHPITV